MKKIILLAAAVYCVTITTRAQTTDAKQKTITVSGVAEQEVTPDEIYVQVDLKEYDKKGAGKINLEDIKNNFIAACKSAGIADSNITVYAYDGSTNYWQYRRSRKKDPDLKAGISYWVKLANTQKMDELVDKLDDEATQNFFIAKVDYSKRTELKKQMKTEAIKAAKAKAMYLTEAIGEHIGGAVSINDDEDNDIIVTGYVAQRRYTENTSSNDESSGVTFKKISYQFKVNVVFALQ